jgi:hypothetical protein
MKVILIDPCAIVVGHAKSRLEAAGIACFIQNDVSHHLVGGSLFGPVKTFDPQLVIEHDADEIIARALLAQATASPNHSEWICPQCAESCPAAFTECWNCQTPAPTA